MAIAVVTFLATISLYKPAPPKITSPANITYLSEIIKSDPARLEAALRFISELGLNITLTTPPRPQPTEITLSLNTTEAWAGDQVVATGVLTTRGKPLPRQLVAIFVEGKLAAFTTTGTDGRYRAAIAISIYKPRINITALYLPLPGSTYMPSRASTWLTVLYNTTQITLTAPTQVQWGKPLVVEITHNSSIQRRIYITLTNPTQRVELTTSTRDTAVVEIPTTNLMPGLYTLTAYTPGEGRLGPASASLQINITAKMPKMTITSPEIGIAGSAISISVRVEPPLNVTLYVGDRPFSGTIPLEITTGFTYVRAVTTPTPPYASISATTKLFVINPLQIGALTLAAASTAVILKTQRRKVEAVVREVLKAAPSEVMDVATREVLSALAHAFYKLGERKGHHYSRKMTYREYASIVEPYARDAACLWRIVHLAEKAVYSPHTPTSLEIREAWTCTERL